MNKITNGTIWADREDGKQYRVDAVTDDGKVQISPLKGDGGYRIMAVKSLRSNYSLVAMTEGKAEAEPEPEEKNTPSNCRFPKCQWNALPPFENSQECIGCEGNIDKNWKPVRETPTPDFVGDKKAVTQSEPNTGRAQAGRVQMPDGKVIAGSTFITQVCGKSRDETYKVDSPIRWLLKKGQELLTDKGATIVYGQQLTK